jgi:hypothetical protein
MCPKAGYLMNVLHGISRGKINELSGPEAEDKVSFICGINPDD